MLGCNGITSGFAWGMHVGATGLLLLVSGVAVNAAGSTDKQSDEWRYLQYTEKPHRWISRRLGDMSRQIDSYFATDDLYDEVSGSYGELRLRQRFTELRGNDFNAEFRLKLRIPHSQERLKLLLESDAEKREAEAGELGDLNSGIAGTIDKADNEGQAGISNIFAGVRQQLVNSTGLKIDLDLGIKLHFPPDPFVRGKLRRQWNAKSWAVRLKETPYWFAGEGFGNRMELDLDRRFSKHWAGRASSRHKWEADRNLHQWVNSLSLYRLVSSRNFVAVVATAFLDDETTFQVQSYTAGVRLRRRVHKQWLFVEAIPHVVWAREDQFEPSLAFSLGLEVLFGEKYVKDAEEDLLPPDGGNARGGILVRDPRPSPRPADGDLGDSVI